jgi:Tfp pilus assembly protein PilV
MKIQKGFTLIVASGAMFILSLGVASLLIVLGARVRQHEKAIDRMIAYYLCETGQTLAQVDFRIPGRFSSNYNITYAVTQYRTQVGWGTGGTRTGNAFTDNIDESVFPQRRTYQVKMSGKTHAVHYEITKKSGKYNIASWVDSPLGFPCIYKLNIKATRGFPFFIGGKGG